MECEITYCPPGYADGYGAGLMISELERFVAPYRGLFGVATDEHVQRKGQAKKLTWDAVREIRSSDLRSTKLAKYYGVSDATISHIRSGRTWKE